jgi:hypothetical protein
MNKKITASAVIIVIVAVFIATWFVHSQISNLQIQNSELQDQVNELQEQLRNLENSIKGVRILAFDWTSGWGPGAGGLQWGRAFNITLQNLGNSAVEGLSVHVKLFVNDAEVVWSETGLYGPGIIGYTAEYPHGFTGKLNGSETREIRGTFVSGLDVLDSQVWNQEGQKVFSVKVMMNNTIMDELLLPFA